MNVATAPAAEDIAASAAAIPSKPDYARRFGGLARLYGPGALQALNLARVCVVGVGGVGSWTVEALARSAVGRLTLIDLDHVGESNMNRQIHALEDTLGSAKVQVLADRIAQINPSCVVEAIEDFVTPENVKQLLGGGRFDFVVDATDQVAAKVAIIVLCRAESLPLVTIGAAGGQRDATRIRIADLAHTEHEPLLARVRKRLRSAHGFSRNVKTPFGIAAVFSDEPVANPWTGVGANDRSPSGDAGVTGLNCAGYGSSVAVTAVFGMAAAGHVLTSLARAAAPTQATTLPGSGDSGLAEGGPASIG